jgi:pyruvate,orthophosphate dikinase
VIFDRVRSEVAKKFNLRNLGCLYGTMIEIPRAALKAGEMAQVAEFFSFGTNDLTQMSFGFSRDDVGGFMGEYVSKGLLPADPFQALDQSGVGELIHIAIQRGRATRPNLQVGICGEHGGEESSVIFCHRAGMNYVSCSPYRVPIARLAAAKAVVLEKTTTKVAKPRTSVRKAAKPAKRTAKRSAPKARSGKKTKSRRVLVRR